MSDEFVDVTFYTTSTGTGYERRIPRDRGLYTFPGTWGWASTGLVNDASMYQPPVTPCAYCGLKAPADVYQCLGCGAPR